MATRVELNKDTVRAALQLALNSEKRAMNGAKPAFKPLHEAEIKALSDAINGLTEAK